MSIKIFQILIPVLVISLSGCKKELIECSEPINVGKMIKNEEIATSFNDSIRSRIETDIGVFIIRGTHSMLKNVDLSLKKCNGSEYLVYKDSSWKIRK